MSRVYDHTQLVEFATALFTKAGLPRDRSQIVASTLVEADLMGHSTHGLALLPAYVDDIVDGKMLRTGDPDVINDKGSSVTWDGKFLPGPWLVHQAIDMAFKRINDHPVVSVAIRQSHHIACLAAYLEKATSKGLLMMLVSSDPRNKTVAPFGGLQGVYSPNPIAFGIPTEGDPIIIDISMSTTSNGLVNRSHQQGEVLPHPWLLDPDGNTTNDPAAFKQDPPATILPLGGLDTGYKGFALGIIAEALTSGLAGHGRADAPANWGASVFLQVIDPEGFGGLQRFKYQSQFLTDACRASRASNGATPVRIPGSRAFRLRDEQKEYGLLLYAGIMASLEKCAEKVGVPVPVWV